ncbi:MAG: hypothetical protein AABY26_03095, partial [Nanoarchaeota archaeon]
ENKQNGLEATLTPPRSTGLVKLLTRLQKEDTWFDYNVPPNIRRAYAEEQLLAYLDATYSQPKFVIDEPNEIKKYVQNGERVIAKENITWHHWKLTSGALGKIIKVKEKTKPLHVIFEEGEHFLWHPNYYYNGPESKPYFNVPAEELIFIGEKKWFGEEIYSTPKQYSEVLKIKKSHLVQYKGKPVEEIIAHLPKGAEGVVASVDRCFQEVKDITVCWAITPGMKARQNPNLTVYPKQLLLVHPNDIDYSKLRQESFTISDFDIVKASNI